LAQFLILLSCYCPYSWFFKYNKFHIHSYSKSTQNWANFGRKVSCYLKMLFVRWDVRRSGQTWKTLTEHDMFENSFDLHQQCSNNAENFLPCNLASSRTRKLKTVHWNVPRVRPPCSIKYRHHHHHVCIWSDNVKYSSISHLFQYSPTLNLLIEREGGVCDGR